MQTPPLLPGGHPLLRSLPIEAASLRLLQRLGFAQTAREDLVFRGEPCTEITLEKRA